MAISRNNTTNIHRAVEERPALPRVSRSNSVTSNPVTPNPVTPNYENRIGRWQQAAQIPEATLRYTGGGLALGTMASVFSPIFAVSATNRDMHRIFETETGQRLAERMGPVPTLGASLLGSTVIAAARTAQISTYGVGMLLLTTLSSAGKVAIGAKRLVHSGVKYAQNKQGRTTSDRQKLTKHLGRIVSPTDHLKHQKIFNKINKNIALDTQETTAIINLLDKRNISLDNRMQDLAYYTLEGEMISHKTVPTNLQKLKEPMDLEDASDADVKAYIRNLITEIPEEMPEEVPEEVPTEDILNPLMLAKATFIEKRTQDLSRFDMNDIKDYITNGPLNEEFGLIFTSDNAFENDDNARLLGELATGNTSRNCPRENYCRALAEAEYFIESKNALIQIYKEEASQKNNRALKEMMHDEKYANFFKLILSETEEGLSSEEKEDRNALRSSLSEDIISTLRDITKFTHNGGRSNIFNSAIAEAKYYIDERITKKILNEPNAPTEDIDMRTAENRYSELFHIQNEDNIALV